MNDSLNFPSVTEQINVLAAEVMLVAFDFDGVFTDNSVWVNQEGMETVRCWRSDGIGLSRLRSIGLELLIISSECNQIVSIRAGKLKTPCIQGVEDKAKALSNYCRDRNIELSRVAFVGNDINDIPAFRIVGLPIAVSDAHQEVYPHVLYRTSCRGGRGAVREVCDFIYNARMNRAERS